MRRLSETYPLLGARAAASMGAVLPLRPSSDFTAAALRARCSLFVGLERERPVIQIRPTHTSIWKKEMQQQANLRHNVVA